MDSIIQFLLADKRWCGAGWSRRDNCKVIDSRIGRDWYRQVRNWGQGPFRIACKVLNELSRGGIEALQKGVIQRYLALSTVTRSALWRRSLASGRQVRKADCVAR